MGMARYSKDPDDYKIGGVKPRTVVAGVPVFDLGDLVRMEPYEEEVH